MEEQDLVEQFKEALGEFVEETGAQLETSKDELALYMADRSTHLSTISLEPGFAQALRAERNNVVMRAGFAVDDNAGSFDQRLLGLVGGLLRIGALALV